MIGGGVLRRRVMDSGEKDPYKDLVYWGSIYNIRYDKWGTLDDYYERPNVNSPTFLSAILPVTPGATVTFSHGFNGHDPRLNDYGYTAALVYDADGEHVGALSSRNGTTLVIPTNGVTIVFSNFIEILDDYWVRDNTTNKYIFKGKNVI